MPTPEEINAAREKALRAAEEVTKAAQEAAEAAEKLKPDRLTKLNTTVTIITGMLTALLAVGGTVFGMIADQKARAIKDQTDAIETKIKESAKKLSDLEVRQKTEDASYKFAEEFLNYIKENHDRFTKGKEGKDAQIAVAALNIIADASSSTEGHSENTWRKALPVKMALLLNDASSVAAMDPMLQLSDGWMEIARWDEDDQTQATAIKALCAICRRSLRNDSQPDLPLALRCLQFADELRSRLMEKKARADSTQSLADPVAAAERANAERIRTDALAELAVIYTDLIKRGWKDPLEEARDDRAKIVLLLKTALGDLQQSTNKLAIAVKSESTGKAPKEGSEAKANEQVLAKAQTVADSVQNSVEQQKITSGESVDKIHQRAKDLTSKLASTKDDERHRARSDLALMGQDAVPDLITALIDQNTSIGNGGYKTRLGVAIALSRMRQPVELDEIQAAWVVSLLSSPDAETRYTTAEFLMNLESDAAVQHCFRALEKLFADSLAQPDFRGSTVLNMAVVVGTWARNLTKDTPSGDPRAKSMPELAWKTANEWRSKLSNSSRQADWAKTISTLDELIRRAEPLWNSERTATTRQAPRAAHGGR